MATYKYNSLVAGGEITSDEVTILSGNIVVEGELLGKVTIVVPDTGTAGGGNAGNGTVTAVAGKAKTKLGVYTLTCLDSVTRFQVVDPNGLRLADALVAEAYVNEQIGFIINGGTENYQTHDIFTITVTAGSGKYKRSLAAAVDGSNHPVVIASEDLDATAGDKVGVAYKTGRFNSAEMTIGTGHTVASTKEELQQRGIILE